MLRYPPSIATATYNLIIKNAPRNNISYNLKKIEVTSTYASDRYLMVFSGSSIPSNGETPIIASQLVGTNYQGALQIPYPGIVVPSPGIVIVASSTKDTLTKDVSATWDITAYVEEIEVQTAGTSVAGDLTSAAGTLQVWTASSGASTKKRLLRIQATNTHATDQYIVVYATDSPASTDKIIAYFPILATSGAIDVTFGDGITPYQKTSAGVESYGCTIVKQSALTAGMGVADTDGTIRATYK